MSKFAREVAEETYELVLLAAHVGDVHVVGGRAQVFELLASEDVNSDRDGPWRDRACQSWK